MNVTLGELLPWVSLALNLLLVPGIRLLITITRQLAVLTTTQLAHEKRLDKVDSDVGELRDDVHRAMTARSYGGQAS